MSGRREEHGSNVTEKTPMKDREKESLNVCVIFPLYQIDYYSFCKQTLDVSNISLECTNNIIES